jgi:hypothetical protein
MVELLRMYCPTRIILNPAGTTQKLRVLTYPGVRVVVAVQVVPLRLAPPLHAEAMSRKRAR